MSLYDHCAWCDRSLPPSDEDDAYCSDACEARAELHATGQTSYDLVALGIAPQGAEDVPAPPKDGSAVPEGR